MTTEQSRSSFDGRPAATVSISRRAVLGGLALTGLAAAATSVPGPAVAGPRDHGPRHHRPRRSRRACRVLASYGDRNPGTVASYPPPVFKHVDASAHFIDITKVEQSLGAPAGTNAVANDPTHDCSTAFNFALDWLADIERPLGSAATQSLDTTLAIYVPPGTYYVAHPIRYSGPELVLENGNAYWVHMRIIGKSRGGSIIRAMDNSADFAAGQNKAVVDFPRDAVFNNWEAQTVLRHLTVHTGWGNPGATAVKFFGANNADIEDVRLVSGDGFGRAGLDMSIGIGSGYVHDVRIEGFDYGITMQKYHFIAVAMEYITLRNQRLAGIRATDCLPSLRSVDSNNTCPGVLVDGDGANVVLVDASLASPSTVSGPAIDVTRNGQVFVRDVVTARYGSAVRVRGSVVQSGPNVAEYVSGGVRRYDASSPSVSLGLPVEATPTRAWPANSEWVNVDAYGAVGDGTTDDSDAIEEALNAGKPVVYFPSKAYRVNRTLTVPTGVKRLALLFSSLTSETGQPIFEVVGTTAASPLVVEDLHRLLGAALIRHSGTRPLVLDTLRAGGFVGSTLYVNNATGANGDLYLNNVNGLRADAATLRQQKVWARWINTESKATANFAVGNGATLWVLGYKVEGGTISFDVTSGGRLEVLGGVSNQYGASTFNDGVTPDIPFRVVDGEVSIVAASNGPNPVGAGASAVFTTVVDDTQSGVRHPVMWDDLPVRAVTPGNDPVRTHQWVLPLYTN